MKVLFVVGARPNFMKVAPVMQEMAKYPDKFDMMLIHTGQHYDEAMSQVFIDELGLPKPFANLNGVGSVWSVAEKLKQLVSKVHPNLMIVVGDVDSSLMAYCVALHTLIPVAHIEAGLRCGDLTMPEERNRILIDKGAKHLFVTEQSGVDNLINEGINYKKIHFVGNTMIDTLLRFKKKAQESTIRERLGISKYGIITLHRPSNVDDPEIFKRILDVLEEVAKEIPLIFPMHPRIWGCLTKKIITIPPLGYLDFLCLMSNAKVVLTDSGGIQEETTVLGVPCLTLRENTERPITVSEGTNTVVGTSPKNIIYAASTVLSCPKPRKRLPKLWDGHAAERIVNEILNHYALS